VKAAKGSVWVIGALLLAGGAQQAWAAAAVPQTLNPSGRDQKALDEMAQDLARFTEAVRGYRTAVNSVIKRAYLDKMKQIRAKYDPLIVAHEKEVGERRLDAIAMLEAFLRKYPDDKRWTPDAMFRLAELYYEKSFDEFLVLQEGYQKQLDSPTPPTTPAPKPDYTNTISLYKRLLTDFPTYRLLDAAYYLLGFCLGEMGQEAEAKQALLALTCSNKYKPLDPPAKTPANAATASTRGPLVDAYKDCKPIKKDSKFVPEAWTRVGEMHFDAAELPLAISAYSRVLDYKESAYYDKALYKLAWSYYRDNRFIEAIREFDNLVKYADGKKATGDKFGSDLRPEAVQYLGVSFSEPDWDGDTVADAETGLTRAQNFYRGREQEPHVKEVFQRIGDIYFDQTRYADAVATYKVLLSKWPHYGEAPKIQDKIVRAYERDRNMVMAARERELLGRNYSKGTDWYNANRNNPEALAAAQQLSEDALLTAGTNVHASAQACRNNFLAKAPGAQSLEQCQEMYRTAAELYEKYLQAYPNSKRSYEFSGYHADALYYGGKLPEAVIAYQKVRDSNLDNRLQQESAFQIIKIYEEMIEKMKSSGQLDDPPIPDEKNTRPPVAPMAMADVYKRYVEAMDWYVANVRDDKVADLRYAGAVMLLKHKNWPEARGRLTQLTDAYCATKPEVGFKSYDALLTTYFIDYNIEDEEMKDCALGRLLMIADQFGESACSKSPKAAEYLARINQIKASVKAAVITKRLKIAEENEEKGTSRQLVQCRDGTGGIDIALGGARPGSAARPGAAPGTPGAPGAPGTRPQAPRAVSTEMDVALALDLIDLVNQNPRDQDAPTNLNNACVVYEKLYQFGEATKCYERLAKDYPDSNLSKDAVWNAARNHRRFFNFDKAVGLYQQIATDPKYANYEHRKDALGLAAQLLDNDQQYARAAEFYKRYSESVPDKPKDASQAHTFACNAYEKLKDFGRQRQCLQEVIKKYGTKPESGEDVVQAYLKLAILAEQSGKKKDTLDAYKKVRDEFVNRSLPTATPAAAAAAKAEFLLAEEKFTAFKAKSLRFTADEKQVKKTFDTFTNDARALSDEYKKVWDYRDATWTLAAFLRSGDIYYEFAQKMIKASDDPPDQIKALDKKACRGAPDTCGQLITQYKDAILTYVTPIEDEAKKQWKATLARAAELGVTNDYVKKARENLSKYLPDEFPFVKDERIAVEQP
jgi:tetratricopeptide (TPR) repeat protein